MLQNYLLYCVPILIVVKENYKQKTQETPSAGIRIMNVGNPCARRSFPIGIIAKLFIDGPGWDTGHQEDSSYVV